MRRFADSEKRLELIKDLRSKDKTFREIGKLLGVSGQRIQQILASPRETEACERRQARRQQVKALLESGLSRKSIAKKIGVSYGVILNDLKYVEVTDYLEMRRQRVKTLIEEGLTLYHIAEKLEISVRTVRNDCSYLGIKITEKTSKKIAKKTPPTSDHRLRDAILDLLFEKTRPLPLLSLHFYLNSAGVSVSKTHLKEVIRDLKKQGLILEIAQMFCCQTKLKMMLEKVAAWQKHREIKYYWDNGVSLSGISVVTGYSIDVVRNALKQLGVTREEILIRRVENRVRKQRERIQEVSSSTKAKDLRQIQRLLNRGGIDSTTRTTLMEYAVLLLKKD